MYLIKLVRKRIFISQNIPGQKVDNVFFSFFFRHRQPGKLKILNFKTILPKKKIELLPGG